MIKGRNFVIRHVLPSDLPALVPLLNDPDIRGEYLPSAIHSPVDLERKIRDDGMANDGLVRLVIVEQPGDAIIGTIWHSKAVPYFNAREIGRSQKPSATPFCCKVLQCQETMSI